MDNGGLSIIQPGAVLVIQEDGILGAPPSESNVPLTTFKVQEGVRQPGTASRASRLLRAGDKVYVTKITVDSANDSVLLTIVECDACNSVQKPSSLISQLVFELPKGYLQTADASQVSDNINDVLLPEAAIPATEAGQGTQPSSLSGLFISLFSQAQLQFKPDGSFAQHGPGSWENSGHFTANGETLSLMYPATGRFSTFTIRGDTIYDGSGNA